MTAPQPQFKKASRQQQKLKIALTGPSGSGKTKGALQIAAELAQGQRFAVIDAENGSASLYADQYEFDTLDITPPYLSSKYIAAIRAAQEAGYSVLVIDSTSHQWEGEGGILQRKDLTDAKPGSNRFTNWNPFTKEHNEFRAAILNSPIHVVATMRSKQAYQQVEGSKKIEKLGLQPLQREGAEYEYTLTFDLAMDHKADASKDRTELFDGKRTDLLKDKVGITLLKWLSTAAPYVPPPAAVAAPEPTPSGPTLVKDDVLAKDRIIPFGPKKGTPIGGLEDTVLEEYLKTMRGLGDPKYQPYIDAVSTVLEERKTGEAGRPVAAAPASFEDFPEALAETADDLPF